MLIGERGVEAREHFRGIDGFDRVEKLRRNASFIGLKVADEVKSSLSEIAEQRLLQGEFLNVILAERPKTGSVGFRDSLRREFLRDGH